MGFSVRKRTKGKDYWVNGSVSSRGVHTSVSTKFGKDITLNSGRKSRVTINFGNGLRFIKSSSTRKSKIQENSQERQNWEDVKSHVIKRVLFFSTIISLFILFSWLSH